MRVFAEPAFWDAAVLCVLAMAALAYVVGLWRFSRDHGGRRSVRGTHMAAFAGGISTIGIALLSPLDSLSDILFSAHMGQHEILMLLSAPLLVAARPGFVALWALPVHFRETIGGALGRPPVRRAWRMLTSPLVAFSVHGIVLWAWHVPELFERAMGHEAIHAIQHLTFFLTAALFWWALVQGRYGRAGYGAAVLFVFLTGLHSGVLGVLFVFARRSMYGIHAARTMRAGMEPVEDQQLAGLVMWIPAGALLMMLALALFWAWLGEAERRAARSRRRPGQPIAREPSNEPQAPVTLAGSPPATEA